MKSQQPFRAIGAPASQRYPGPTSAKDRAGGILQGLVGDKQFTQSGCPMSGGKVKDGTHIKVGDTKVGFCCPNCKAKVEGAEDTEAKMKLVFNKDAFKKGFKKTKTSDDD